ncbi:Uncharacterized membrane protein YfcC, ion transporter superfamily [Anaerobranca californiensis DSM 14826]|jgi:uncharacterized ion transporter superfamily protein YfcC|uniref:Uncharacterized membrane protein YfcC, ion transporter superfamily n=1 Tax=Anaerobranca californiensis DSM 14826 TaxID=1120989 RepID=A0A1M6L212_9FIRM|nr:TIGR00366 family protein [Anaerobranca californiensis]SHJ65152.1 Uncharacterized membrane protein YfcC, ion transporter superfamily [Anaerobranca californiensis DSM 14826]
MKNFKVPHTYVIIFIVVLVAFLGTYLVPAGVYERVQDPKSNRVVVDPDSFQYVEQNPVKFFSFEEPHLFSAIHRGMQGASSIIFFIFIVGGAFAMIQGTGAIDAGIGRLALKVKDKGILIIPIMAFIFALGGSTIGMSEEIIVFVPIGIALARALGYDAIVGTGMIALGAAAGFSAGFANPFTVGVAQAIAEVPLYSGFIFRLIMFIVFLIITSWYVISYALKVKRNPSFSIVADLEEKEDKELNLENLPTFTVRHLLVYLVLLVGFVLIIIGIRKYDWYIQELASIFLMMGIFSSLIGGISPSKSASNFVEGAKSIAFGALVVGVARAILVVMEQGQIIDTIIHSLAIGISSLPSVFAALLMYFVQIILNFFIPSGSGQAATTMPIMAPLADLVGVTRQTAVIAYQLGDGITNSIIPTSAVLMSYLAIARIPYEKWFKWVTPWILMNIGAGAVFLVIASLINLG